EVSVRNPVPEQILCLSKLVAKLPAGGELDLVGFLGQRCDGGPMVFAWRASSGRVETKRKRLCRDCDGPLRELADRRRDRRLRREMRNQFLDLALRFACRLREQLAIVLGRQVRREQSKSSQADLPRAQGSDHGRQSSR